MRTNNSVKNSIISVISNIILIIVGMLVQTVFINTLGEEYLGLNGLFTNIISILAIVEIGIGPAIIYSLYKPFAQNDISRIRGLIEFYRKSYNRIAIAILAISVIILPLIPIIVGKTNIPENIYIIFILFIIDVIASYLYTYKRSILYADQKNRVITVVHLGAYTVMNIFQIGILLLTKNYMLYLCVKIVFRIIENIVINYIVNKKYSFAKKTKSESLDKEDKKTIMIRIKGLIMHKVGGTIVLGTDNILISYFIGIEYVGLYSNYLLITNALNLLISQIFTAIVSSIGNLLVTSDSIKIYETYKKMQFINHVIAIVSTSVFFLLIQPFIEIWVGKEYLLDNILVIAITVNLYLMTMRKAIGAFKDAAGIFYEDRYIPIIEAVANIVGSIIGIHFFGLLGVFLGTTLSHLILFIYSYPKYVYKKLFNRSKKEYIANVIKEAIIAVFIVGVSNIAIINLNIENIYLNLMIIMLISIVLPLIFITILYFRSNEFEFFKNMIKQFIKKIKKSEVEEYEK